MKNRSVWTLAAFSVLACDDPAIPVPVEFETARGRDLPGGETVMSVGIDGEHLVIEGMLWHYCEDFSATASQWIDGRRSVVTLNVQSNPPAYPVCIDMSKAVGYTASIEVRPFVTTGSHLNVWEVRVYHRGKPIQVPQGGYVH